MAVGVIVVPTILGQASKLGKASRSENENHCPARGGRRDLQHLGGGEGRGRCHARARMSSRSARFAIKSVTCKNAVGPILTGVVGRKAGTGEGFNYSPAMKKAGEDGTTWTEENIDKYLTDPKVSFRRTRWPLSA